MSKIDNDFKIYAKSISKDFYSRFFCFNLNNIDETKILTLKTVAKNLLEEEFITSDNLINYVKKMRRLIRDDKYKIFSISERYLIFMFSVDPTFEAFKIYGECDRINEAKLKTILYLGAYDLNLIKMEKEFIKKFFTQKEIDEINEEIDKRAFK